MALESTFERKVKWLANEDVPEGPWTTEPDKAQWIDPATGLDCLIVRNHGGALCGYVGVPPGHPCYGKGYDEIDGVFDGDTGTYSNQIADIQIHGGLTFAAFCQPGEPAEGICHIAEHGATPEPWWLGFDTGHADDRSPYDAVMEQDPTWPLIGYKKAYRDFAYVTAECTELAGQLAKLA